MGQEMVGQKDRLRSLHMGVARQVGVPGFASAVEEHLLEGDDAAGYFRQGTLGEQPEVGRHLVVAAASGVQPASDVTRNFCHPALEGGVDVLVVGSVDERALGDLLLDGAESGQQRPVSSAESRPER